MGCAIMFGTTISNEELRIIDGTGVTNKDCSLLRAYLVTMNKLVLATPDDIDGGDITMGQWIARIWRSIENVQ